MIINSVIKTCDKLININNYIRELCDDPIMSNRNENDDLRIFQRVSCLKGLPFELSYNRDKLLVYNQSSNAINIINTVITILDQIDKLKLEYINNNLIGNTYYYDYLPSLQNLCDKLNYMLLDLRQEVGQLKENELTYLLKYAYTCQASSPTSSSSRNKRYKSNSSSSGCPSYLEVITDPYVSYTIAQYILDRPEEQPPTTDETTKAAASNSNPNKEESKLRSILDQKAYDLQQQLHTPLPNNITLETLYTNIPPRADYDDFRCVLGQGVLCHTYRKQNVIDNMIYAVKVIRAREIRSNYLCYDTIYTEALALQAISHMYIVRHLVVFKSYNNELINIVMELVDGSSLAKYTHDTTTAGRPSKELLTKWLEQTLRALQYLHDDMHILHRDIKPDNILITSPQQDVKLIGIDLATIACSSLYNNILCVSLYASLEKADNYEYDGRDDVWAVGCIWSELLTGVSLQQRDVILCRPQSAAVLTQVIEECIVCDARLGAVIARMLVSSEADRATASECLQVLTDGTLDPSPPPTLITDPAAYPQSLIDSPPQPTRVDYSMAIDEGEYSYSDLANAITAIDLSSPDPVESSGSPMGYTSTNPMQLSEADELFSSQPISAHSLVNSPLDNTFSYEPLMSLPLQADAPTQVSNFFDPNDNPTKPQELLQRMMEYEQRAVKYPTIVSDNASTEKAVPPRSFLPLQTQTTASFSSPVDDSIYPPIQNQLPRVPLAADKSTVSWQPYRVPPHTMSAAVVGSDSRPRRRLIALDKDNSSSEGADVDAVAEGEEQAEVETEVEGTVKDSEAMDDEKGETVETDTTKTVVKLIPQPSDSSSLTLTATTTTAVIPVHEMSIAKAEEILIDIYSISNTELWQLRCLNDYLIKLLEVGYGGGKDGWTQMDLVRFFRGEPPQGQAPVVTSSGSGGGSSGKVDESQQRQGQGQAPVVGDSSDSGGSGGEVDRGIGVEGEGEDKRGKRQVRVRTSPSTPMQGISHISPTRRKEA